MAACAASIQSVGAIGALLHTHSATQGKAANRVILREKARVRASAVAKRASFRWKRHSRRAATQCAHTRTWVAVCGAGCAVPHFRRVAQFTSRRAGSICARCRCRCSSRCRSSRPIVMLMRMRMASAERSDSTQARLVHVRRWLLRASRPRKCARRSGLR